MRAVCSGTDGIGCCGQSDMAKPPEITAPTPLSTLRLTHSPTVSGPKWDSQALHPIEEVQPRLGQAWAVDMEMGDVVRAADHGEDDELRNPAVGATHFVSR